MSFDPESMREIAMLASAGIFLDPALQRAERQIGQLIITKTHDNALERFKENAPGGLAESFFMTGVSQFEIEVGSNAPHSHRRDKGFGEGGSEATDSLGRVYHDRAYLYFSDAVTEVETSGEGLGILQLGVQEALGRMGVAF